MATTEANKTKTEDLRKMVTREDIARGNAEVGDLVAFARRDNGTYEIAKIISTQTSSAERSRLLNKDLVNYRIKCLTGDSRGTELQVVPASTNAKVGEINLTAISRTPQERLQSKGSIETKLADRLDIYHALVGKNTDMLPGKLAIVDLKEEGRRAYALVEILPNVTRTEGGSPKFRVNVLATKNSGKAPGQFMLVDTNAFVERPSYELL